MKDELSASDLEILNSLLDNSTGADGKPARWKFDLRMMAQENRPVFRGTIERDWWKHHLFITWALQNELIERAGDQCFIITAKGIAELEAHGIDAVPHPPRYWEDRFEVLLRACLEINVSDA